MPLRLLMLTHGKTLMKPIDDPENGGGGGLRGSEAANQDTDDDGDDGDEDDDSDDLRGSEAANQDDDEPDDDETDDDEDDDGDDDDDSDDEGDEDLGARATKRINKLIAERKEAQARVKALEGELKEAKKLAGDDGKAILRAAETSGILPGLMTKDEAEAFRSIDQYRAVIANYERWLDEHDPDDEFEIDEGRTMSYAKVERRVRKLQGELGELKDEYGPRRKELLRKVREIFEAGVEALKAGRKPAGKKPKKAERKDESKKQKPKGNNPRPKRVSGRRLEEMEVDDDDSLEAYITEMRRKK